MEEYEHPTITTRNWSSESLEVSDHAPGESERGGCRRCLKEEFGARRFLFDHDSSEDFYLSSLPGTAGRVVFVTFRLIAAIYSLITLFMYGTRAPSGRLPPAAFLSLWSYAVLTIYLTVAAGSAVFAALRDLRVLDCLRMSMSLSTEDNACSHQSLSVASHTDIDKVENGSGLGGLPVYDEDGRRIQARSVCCGVSLPLYYQIQWYFWVLATDASPIVSTIFYGLFGSHVFVYHEFAIHGMNVILVFIDIVLARTPSSILHFPWAMMYGIVYILFSVILWGADSTTTVYPGVLDWNIAGRTTGTVVLLTFVAIPIIHAAFHGAIRLRAYLYSFLRKE